MFLNTSLNIIFIDKNYNISKKILLVCHFFRIDGKIYV